jgi:hypothetical protein
MEQTWLWIGFNVFVLVMLAVDLFVFHRDAREVRGGSQVGEPRSADNVGCEPTQSQPSLQDSSRPSTVAGRTLPAPPRVTFPAG